ncbi:hypothetical protein B0H11DRAFT_1915958 [Mycena galericulata]|nr:hypothetical protein B0H11DRAFT_1927773 [Mycena galericulata]KAJ7480212.1 hypothetical protein B0H11DRAFT_1915958 [Mycena galericulata]
MKFSLSLLALCSVACAVTVPRAFPPTNIAKDTADKRELGTVYLCDAAFFSGYCIAIQGEFDGGCIDLGVDLDNQISSFGPDQGQQCQLFNAHSCVTSGVVTPGVGIPAGPWSGPVAYLGIQDLSQSWIDADGSLNAPFTDIISSYRSVFHFPPSVMESSSHPDK